jgi:hypothetical protein
MSIAKPAEVVGWFAMQPDIIGSCGVVSEEWELERHSVKLSPVSSYCALPENTSELILHPQAINTSTFLNRDYLKLRVLPLPAEQSRSADKLASVASLPSPHPSFPCAHQQLPRHSTLEHSQWGETTLPSSWS